MQDVQITYWLRLTAVNMKIQIRDFRRHPHLFGKFPKTRRATVNLLVMCRELGNEAVVAIKWHHQPLSEGL